MPTVGAAVGLLVNGIATTTPIVKLPSAHRALHATWHDEAAAALPSWHTARQPATHGDGVGAAVGAAVAGVGAVVVTECLSPTEHITPQARAHAGRCAAGLASHTTVQAAMHGDGVGAPVGAEVGLPVGAELGAAVGAAVGLLVSGVGATIPVV